MTMPVTEPEVRLAAVIEALLREKSQPVNGRRRDPAYARLINWIELQLGEGVAPQAILAMSDAEILRHPNIGRACLAEWRRHVPFGASGSNIAELLKRVRLNAPSHQA